MNNQKEHAQLNREEQFHDAWAESTQVEGVDVDAVFQSQTALELRYLQSILGDVRGKTILEVGCGLGEASVGFAKLGAKVTATDLSPGMVDFAQRLARRYGVEVSGAVGAAEELDLPAGSFDIIYAANTIHHLADRDAFYQRVKALLKPGGVFCAWDPVKYNPVINVYRRMASEVRSIDERPLGKADLAQMALHFPILERRHFWLLTQLIFLKYFVLSRISPSKERYWKLIYKETDQSLWWWRPLLWADNYLLEISGVRWLSWNIVIVARVS